MAKVANKGRKQMCAVWTARRGGLLPPPVGTSDWARFSRDSYCVDKTLILKDLIDSKSRVALFTRPRRFDKKGGISAVENALRERDPFLFGKYLAAYLKESVSFFDTAAEGFYHGLVLGFIACFRNRFVVKSNRESGEGRYDISMRPLVDGMPGVVIELKAAEDETEDLDTLAREARRQIDTRECTTEMLADFAAHDEKRDILKFGMAFYKKNLVVCKELRGIPPA